MSDTAAYAALVLIVLCILTLVAALLITKYREGSLQADIKFARNYVRIHCHKNTPYNR